MNVSLAVAAHTNVGKTTLVRTLLKRDIGEVADRPHVTEDAERHTLLDTAEGDVLSLWDTPGFGDSARLLKRLRGSGNPLGWLQTQVWDRFVDRPFFCSQRAIMAVRDEADVVLYLVNAAEDPAAAAYVDAELQILAWIGKPVLLLLNQSGPPRSREAEAADEARWNRQLAAHLGSSGVITLDAFARCWVQEDRLLREACALLEGDKRAAMDRLRDAWRVRNVGTFHAAMRAIAAHLAELATDHEPAPDKAAESRAMKAMGDRLEARLKANADRLIVLHGLAGRAQSQILARTEGQFDVARPADVKSSGLLGGVVTGALGGLAADASAGGITLGAGMLIGAILGALGASGAARAYNLLQGHEDGSVRWSQDFLLTRAKAAVLRYLAVAHYGRGRGDWVEGEAPKHWAALVDSAVAQRADALRHAWSGAQDDSAGVGMATALEREIEGATRAVLVQLYPEAAAILS